VNENGIECEYEKRKDEKEVFEVWKVGWIKMKEP
jgi:hypothetical protein